MTPRVTDIAFTTAPPTPEAKGLLGWACFTLDGLYGIDGFGVRRTSGGRLALSFSGRVDAPGHAPAFERSLDAATRLAIEVQVFDVLAQDGRLAS